MSKWSVFLLQDTKELNDELEKKLNETEEFEVVGSTEDGLEAVSMVRRIEPDFLITGMVLSSCDGITVINKIKQAEINTKIIVLSAFCGEEIISLSLKAGASFFMAKPYVFENLKKRMLDLVGLGVFDDGEDDSHKATSLEEKISKIFLNVGIPPHIKGYSFLREGVKMAIQEPAIINSITKQLYPRIGEKYDTSASKVERAIRHAIEVAWNRGRIETINSVLGVKAYFGTEKPTNGEFIALVADKMLLENH